MATASKFQVPNDCRITEGPLATTEADGNNGHFIVTDANGQMFRVQAQETADMEAIRAEPVPVARQITPEDLSFAEKLFWMNYSDTCFRKSKDDFSLWRMK